MRASSIKLLLIIAIITFVVMLALLPEHSSNEVDTSPSTELSSRADEASKIASTASSPHTDDLAVHDELKIATPNLSAARESLRQESGPLEASHTQIVEVLSPDEKAARIDEFVTAVGLEKAAQAVESILQSEAVDSNWAKGTESALSDAYKTPDTEAIDTPFFQCAETVCYADFAVSAITYRTQYFDKTRELLSNESSGLLTSSFFVSAGAGLIRQYYFSDTFDVTSLAQD